MSKLVILSVLALAVLTAAETFSMSWVRPIVLVPGLGGFRLNDSRIPNTYYSRYSETEESFNYPVGRKAFLGDTELFSYFTDLIIELNDIGYHQGHKLFGFSYDWTKQPDDEAILSRFHRLVRLTNPIVIAHSTGGLLVEAYERMYPDNMINRIIYVSVPFKGVGGEILKAYITHEMPDELFSLLPHEDHYPPMKIDYSDHTSYFSYYGNRGKSNTTTHKYYLASGNIKTPYDYVHGKFSYVAGDGVVPVQSALHAIEHNQPSDHNILLDTKSDHVNLMGSIDFLDTIITLIGMDCMMTGYYENDGDIIFLIVKNYHLHKHSQDYTSRYVYIEHVEVINCTNIEYEGKLYSRIYGDRCVNTFKSISYPQYEFINICIYGYLFNYIQYWCKIDDVIDCDRDYAKDITRIIYRIGADSPPNQSQDDGCWISSVCVFVISCVVQWLVYAWIDKCCARIRS